MMNIYMYFINLQEKKEEGTDENHGYYTPLSLYLANVEIKILVSNYVYIQ